jgi:hypothetical protein
MASASWARIRWTIDIAIPSADGLAPGNSERIAFTQLHYRRFGFDSHAGAGRVYWKQHV